ncbi:metallophosphoesterase family protein [Mucilaginibacter jinjuensis]|uniref:Metallophosphoesterase n=1 Tax=Mucilaginibacter jinjuensis TaxID=1176721 RepID=A0ABY7TFS6_9SPHI|nr:metallophosphoesterase [Mucilaginibacter jinjuensis]WCT14845.1 metallophosphoesterase [Mucilaginibacter jinjuensis]
MIGKITVCRFVFCLGMICFPHLIIAQVQHPVIDFVSDTQAPLFVERIIRKINHNEKATEMIFKDIITIHPASLFLLGDVVSLSSLDSKWNKMDTYLKRCRDSAIPVYAALGNHEFMWSSDKGTQNFQLRFPMHKPTGYVEVVDSVAVVLLNSNFSKMQTEDIKQQDDWYNLAIAQLEADSAVKFIVVGCHHSPFTNSEVVSPSMQVQQKFVPAFIRSKKCVLFLSGHSHNFEQFKVQGKYFLVIGGGGGPHQPIRTKDESTPDLSPNYKPMFHYLEVKREHDSLQVISRRLKTDFSGFDDGLKFNVGN